MFKFYVKVNTVYYVHPVRPENSNGLGSVQLSVWVGLISVFVHIVHLDKLFLFLLFISVDFFVSFVYLGKPLLFTLSTWANCSYPHCPLGQTVLIHVVCTDKLFLFKFSISKTVIHISSLNKTQNKTYLSMHHFQ